MSSIQLAHTRITIMTRKALVLTTLAGLGLSACSTQQMVQSSAESVSTILVQVLVPLILKLLLQRQL